MFVPSTPADANVSSHAAGADISAGPTWHGVDIDDPPNVALGSNTSNSSCDALTVSGRGKFESGDQVFRYVYTRVTGDFTVTARLDGVDFAGSTSTNARAGLLLAPDLSTVGTDFLYGGAMSVADGSYRRTDRLSVGSKSGTSKVSVSGSGERYLRLTRTGDTYEAAFSLDGGATYTAASAETFSSPLPDTVPVGFAVDSGSTSNSASATFSDVHIVDANGNQLPVGDQFCEFVTVNNPGSQTGVVGAATNLLLSATGGTAPYTWSASGLPAGLSIDSSSGKISGTPTTAGSFDVSLTATDAQGATGHADFTWTVVGNGFSTATGDTRTVTKPHVPPVCRTLPAHLTTSDRTFSTADEASPPDTARIQAALDACAGSDGAVVLSAAGRDHAFLSAPLTLPSSVTLVIDSGVTLYASRNPADYQVSGRDGCGTITTAGGGCHPFITVASHSAHNGIMGTGGSGNGRGRLGVIDGRGDQAMLGTSETWWQLARAAASGGKQNNPRLIQANSGADFTVYDVELANAAQFTLRYTGDGLTVWGIRINARATARNVDGVDPSGSDATIRDSWIQSGDDGVAIKAGSSSATDMTIENNHFYGSHGLSIGSETNGGVRNILFRNNTLMGTDSYGNVSTFNNGIRIKSDPTRGGLVQQVTYQNTCMSGVQTPIAFTPFYATDQGALIPLFTNIVVDGAVAVHSTPDAGSQLFGFDAAHPLGLSLQNVQLDNNTAQAQDANVRISNSTLVPSGPDVTVTKASLGGKLPVCTFPPFPGRAHGSPGRGPSDVSHN